MNLDQLVDYNASVLQTGQFKDYSPNGLQVEGRGEVTRIATAVTASKQVIDESIAWGADAILVHHGYFWRNEDPCIVGVKKHRIAELLKHDVSLLAYHLPLDAHTELGNNARLAAALGLREQGRFGEQNIACHGALDVPLILADFAGRIESALQRAPLVIGHAGKMLHRAAWCSGGGQGYFEAAIAQGVDVFVTGEVSEQSYHLARETGVAFIAAGHHASERLGIQALGEHLANRFNLQHRFFDQDNPV
ncbi:MAG TPA: Nif3-like dinuclear metal center hexameric protein [Gallionella sp.]|jgi:dinuclear metal center YbgI/SA1388 family protein|nr:Nif3-like dinuclear metal center hexameric protein [Gallionella sp.]OGS66224.1 MAG: Nif3-like dinuclear metal center hexameric protein [Gallionellales bacterium GWA2_54_124]OGT32241.1 MAG: Nif3-like dinuclear metal center hexameric protein [Gallionellales bacterium RIFOXYD2_FULL_52_7]HCI52836.1 Nif3-like dinuclear metal center hexameric protein [Gallionella sp.]